jgi:DNA-binding NtrC family response regulator
LISTPRLSRKNIHSREESMEEVLLFDNHSGETRLLEEILIRLGCRVTLAETAHDCLEKINHTNYVLVIFDHSIPGLDVSDFVAKIEEITLTTPLSMMVTFSSRFYEEKYGCSGIDFLIFKPFGFSQVLGLVAAARKLARRLRGTY